jgi:hypothetical protein
MVALPPEELAGADYGLTGVDAAVPRSPCGCRILRPRRSEGMPRLVDHATESRSSTVSDGGGGAPTQGVRMIHCAAATALPRPVEHCSPSYACLPMSDRDKDIEILAGLATSACHPAAPDRQATADHHRPRVARRAPALAPADPAAATALIVSPETTLRWHRDLLRRGPNASRSKRPGRPPTAPSRPRAA